MAAPTDKVGIYLSVGVYIFLYLVALFLLPNLLIWLGGYFFGGILSQFAAAVESGSTLIPISATPLFRY